jgi:hypothetical protein
MAEKFNMPATKKRWRPPLTTTADKRFIPTGIDRLPRPSSVMRWPPLGHILSLVLTEKLVTAFHWYFLESTHNLCHDSRCLIPAECDRIPMNSVGRSRKKASVALVISIQKDKTLHVSNNSTSSSCRGCFYLVLKLRAVLMQLAG